MTAVFGRDPELAAVKEFIGPAADGPAVLQVEGEPGIGKTTLVKEAVDAARAQGVRVLSSRPAQAEATMAFAALADLLGAVERDATRPLPAPQRHALDVALLRASPGPAPVDPRAVATGLLSLLERIGAAGPALVAIDDLQWIDSASAGALAFAVRRLGPDRRVRVLTAVRVEPPQVPDPLGLGALEPSGTRRIRLGPLGLGALQRLVDTRLDVSVSRPTLQRIRQQSAGNPLFALELGRALYAGDLRPGAPLPVDHGLRELLEARTARLPERTNEALLAIALLGEPPDELLERALGHPARDLHAAVDAGLIEHREGRVRFSHPLYAAAVEGAAPTAALRALHARLAAVVDDPEERARHRAAATEGPDEDVARELDAGADVARSRGAWVSAAELLERARDLTPAALPDQAARRGIAAAEHHVHAGDRTRGRQIVEAVLAAELSGLLRADALRLLGEISYDDESFLKARPLYEEALAHAGDTRVAALAELGLAYVHSNLMDWQQAGEHAARALSVAEEMGDSPLAADAMAYIAMMRFLCGQGVDWARVERSLELEDPDAVAPLSRSPRTIHAFLLLYSGRHEDARERLRALAAEVRERGDESDLAFVLLWTSWLETRAGNLGEAAELADEAAALATLTGTWSMHAWVLTQQALVRAHAGDLDEALRLCDEAEGPVRQSDNLLPALWTAATRGLAALSAGDPAAAWDACGPGAGQLEERGLPEPVIAFFLPEGVEALIALGETDRAERLIDLLEERGRALDRVWALAAAARLRGLLEAERGDLTAADAALELALAHHERIELGFERARALLAHGVVRRRAGQRKRARETLESARAAFEGMGARLWAERAAAELASIPIRRGSRDADELTPTESRTAELVAQGHTNREVARTLFVSEKAVEAHLTRVYRKLGVRSRTALAAKLAGGELQVTPEP